MILIETDIGDVVAIRGTLLDEDGTPITGATVTARALPPVGAEINLGTAPHQGAGVYKVFLTPTLAGSWAVRLTAASPSQAAAEGIVYVRETRFP